MDNICCPKGSFEICAGVCCKTRCVVREPPAGLCNKNPELCNPVIYCLRPSWDLIEGFQLGIQKNDVDGMEADARIDN